MTFLQSESICHLYDYRCLSTGGIFKALDRAFLKRTYKYTYHQVIILVSHVYLWIAPYHAAFP